MNRIINKKLFVPIGLLLLTLHSCEKTPKQEGNEPVSVFDNCITPGTDNSFEIVTINLQGYPKAGGVTVYKVEALIKKLNPDIIALQEVADKTDFLNLVDGLNGWQGVFYPINKSPWNLAYLYKTSEIELDDSRTRIILNDDSYTFPRPPFEIYVTHKSLNIGLYLINIHLKCCDGTENENRRRNASLELDNYIKSERANDPVIILGDYNDEISGDSNETNVFYNFVTSVSDYQFTDMGVALSDSHNWSYPSYPSHIDHILISNELFEKSDTTLVLTPDKCYNLYWENISDHRPVELILK